MIALYFQLSYFNKIHLYILWIVCTEIMLCSASQYAVITGSKWELKIFETNIRKVELQPCSKMLLRLSYTGWCKKNNCLIKYIASKLNTATMFFISNEYCLISNLKFGLCHEYFHTVLFEISRFQFEHTFFYKKELKMPYQDGAYYWACNSIICGTKYLFISKMINVLDGLTFEYIYSEVDPARFF